MNNEEKDKKVLLEMEKETGQLLAFLEENSFEEISKNAILEKASYFHILRLSRTYKKLGGRYKNRFKEFHDDLKDWGKRIEIDPSIHDLVFLKEVSSHLSELQKRIQKILSSF